MKHHPISIRNSFLSALALALALFLTPRLEAATHSVCASGCDYSSIQAAVDAAASGDVLELEPETFTEGDISINTQLTIRTASGRATIDGDGELTVFDIDSDGVVFLEDLTLENATRALISNSGVAYLSTVQVNGDGTTNTTYGGIVNYASGYLVLKDSSVVQNNRSTSVGGGISNFGYLELRNCTLIGNRGRLGGGFYNSKGTVSVTSCSISGNHATIRGGGYANVNVNSGIVAVMPSATFSSNTADSDCDKYYDIHVSPGCVN